MLQPIQCSNSQASKQSSLTFVLLLKQCRQSSQFAPFLLYVASDHMMSRFLVAAGSESMTTYLILPPPYALLVLTFTAAISVFTFCSSFLYKTAAKIELEAKCKKETEAKQVCLVLFVFNCLLLSYFPTGQLL